LLRHQTATVYLQPLMFLWFKLDAHGMRPMRFLSACVWFRDVTSFPRLHLWLLFFADFLMVRALLVKTTRLNYSKKNLHILLVLCTWFNSFSIQTWGTPRQMKILMCEKEQKPEPWKKRAPESEPHSWKPRAPELEPCSWKEDLRSWSCVIFTTAPQPWF